MGVIQENFNPFISPGGMQAGIVDPVVVASAVVMPAPKALITTVSGAVAITLIPLPYPGFQGIIIYIPTGLFTGTTAGVATDVNKPIGLAFTAVIGKPLMFIFDGVKWWPGYIA